MSTSENCPYGFYVLNQYCHVYHIDDESHLIPCTKRIIMILS